MKIPFFFRRKEADQETYNATFPDKKSDRVKLKDPLLNDPLTTFEGWANIMPNPDRILRKAGKDIEVYEDLLGDPQLYGVIENNRKPGTTSLTWSIEGPNTPQKELDFYKHYFKNLISDGKFWNLMNRALDTPQIGYMVFGKVWDIVDNVFIPMQIESMPHKYVKFNSRGELLIARDGYDFRTPEDPRQFIVLQHKPTLTNPYGEALLARCFWNISFKKDGFAMWNVFNEKYGMPWVDAEYEPQQIAKAFNVPIAEAATTFLDKITNMVRDGIIAHPKGTTANIVQTGQKANAELFEKMVRICDEQNTKLQLGHSGATESTSGDKLSNDTTVTDVRDAVVKSDKQYPVRLFNRIIQLIHHFNFKSEPPVFSLYKEEDVDQALADRDGKLSPVLTASGLRYSRKYFEINYGLEEDDLEENNNILPPQNTKNQRALTPGEIKNVEGYLRALTIVNEAKNANTQTPLMVDPGDEPPAQTAMDKFIEYLETDLADDNAKITQDMIDELVKFTDESSSIEEVLENYDKVFPKLESKKLLDIATKAINISRIHGNHSEQVHQDKKKKSRGK